EPLRARLESLGARVLVAPCTATEPGDEPALDAAVSRLDGFDWVVVTSVNGVHALAESAGRAGVSLAGAAVRWAAVGPATCAGLEAMGVRCDLVPSGDHSAAGLLAAFDGIPGFGRVFAPLGDLAGPALADGLMARGFEVEVVTAYRTVPAAFPPAVVQAWSLVDAIVLAAPSAARQVAAQLAHRLDVAGVAIGERTAAAAREAGLRVDVVAAAATPGALVDALVEALSRVPD
ncbi:MAG: uroporphyrinogen-III synthase, partial [Actinomycetia bacterium]|nr:uroporphyrinogen-III synthase [Actinomycetes bacterium]